MYIRINTYTDLTPNIASIAAAAGTALAVGFFERMKITWPFAYRLGGAAPAFGTHPDFGNFGAIQHQALKLVSTIGTLEAINRHGSS